MDLSPKETEYRDSEFKYESRIWSNSTFFTNSFIFMNLIKIILFTKLDISSASQFLLCKSKHQLVVNWCKPCDWWRWQHDKCYSVESRHTDHLSYSWKLPTTQCLCQFHQHFTCPFFANILAPKITKLKCFALRLFRKRILTKNAGVNVDEIDTWEPQEGFLKIKSETKIIFDLNVLLWPRIMHMHTDEKNAQKMTGHASKKFLRPTIIVVHL